MTSSLMTSSPRTRSAVPSAVVSRSLDVVLTPGTSSSFSAFPFAVVRRNCQIGGSSVVSSCGRAVWSGRSRPAEERGARIETERTNAQAVLTKVAPQKNAGRGLKHRDPNHLLVCGRRPAEERGARIETTPICV